MIASAERWIGSRQRWSGMRARPSQPRQKRAVAARRSLASSMPIRARELLRPGERAVELLSLFERVPGPHPIALDAERHVGVQPDRQLLAARVGGVAVVVDRPLGGKPPVVEDRLAGELHLDLALQAERDANEQVVGVFVGRGAGVRRDAVHATAGPQREGIAHDHPAGGGLPRGEQHVRPGLVDARRRHVDAEGSEAEGAGLAVEQGAEHAGGVKARHAQPVDGSVGSDQRPGVAVGQECVVGDRREGRGHRRALRAACRLAPWPRAWLRCLAVLARRWLAALARLGRAHDATHGPCQPPKPATSSSPASGPQEPGA